MRRLVTLAVLLAAPVAGASNTPAPGNAPPGCPAGTNWTRTYAQIDAGVDPYAGTTTAVYYTVIAPCWVRWDTDFVVTAMIRDEKCNDLHGQADAGAYTFPVTVGNRWNVTDTPLDTGIVTSIAGARVNGMSGYAAMDVGLDGTWVTTVRQRYTGSVTDHRIGFTFIPRSRNGCYVSGMAWSPPLIGTVTYDPVDPAPGDAPLVATPDAAPLATSEAGGTVAGGTAPGAPEATGGCGSSGVTPALLGLAALAAASGPRRRRGR